MNIGIIDISSFSDKGIYSRISNSAMYSIMPQVIGVYAKKLGHDVWYYPYFGFENLYKNLNYNLDIVFISTYTMNAYLAYAISNIYRQKGITTIIGGPHARSYPEDCRKYFDYVIGLCDFELIKNVIDNYKNRDELGIYLTNDKQPYKFPLLEERWEFIQEIIKRTTKLFRPTISLMSSTGCPNNCDFCIDSKNDYNYLSDVNLYEDLLFLKNQNKKYHVLWHDPNFGIRLRQTFDIIEKINANNLIHGCELNIHKLTQSTCQRLQKNNFIGIAPGLESWKAFDKKSLNNKYPNPVEKLDQISKQMKMVNKYIPVIQLNMIFGLDIDTEFNAEDSFKLTEFFIKKTPGVYVNFQTLTIFGKSTPLREKYREELRLIENMPFHLLDGFSTSNIVLKCDPSLFYKYYTNLLKVEKSLSLLSKKIINCNSFYGKAFYLFKHLTGRLDIKHFKDLSNKISSNEIYNKYFNGKDYIIPNEFNIKLKNNLGLFYNYLPKTILEQI